MSIQSVVCYSFSLAAQEPMAYLRVIAPLRHLGIQIIDGIQDQRPVDELISMADSVLVQREFPMRFKEYQKIVEVARRERKPLVYELDDLLFLLPDDHPDRLGHYYTPSLLPMLQAVMEADVVIVPTPMLQDVLSNYNENVVVFANYLDDHLWSFRPPILKASPDTPIVVGYMGTPSHRPDLHYITPVLLNLLRQYPGIRLRLWGIQPPAELCSHPQVESISCRFHSYEEFAAFFQTQSADIFIAPLRDNIFNRCKSSIKFFEYTASGVPGVFARLEPYESVVEHGQNGLLAYSPQEWEYALVQLIENPAIRYELAVNAQETVRENWLLSQNAFRWAKALESGTCKMNRPRPEADLLKTLRSINHQLFDMFQQLREEIQQLDELVSRKDSEIEQLQTEILGYALSRSWQFTRPFRKLEKRIGQLGKR